VLTTLNGDNGTKPCRKKGLAERQQNRPATSGATNTCCRSDDAARNQRPQRRPHWGLSVILFGSGPTPPQIKNSQKKLRVQEA
jgi:hypothetical protein